MSEPVAILISDLHFTVPTLELAAQSLLQAQFKARMLDVPLIICGDTLDSKAIIRAECANRLMRLLTVKDAPKTYVMVGNHDLCNEKGDDHALQFLHGLCTKVVDSPVTLSLKGLRVMLVPYYSDTEKLKLLLEDEDTPSTLIMHQGVQTAFMGHYSQDKTSLPKEAFRDFRVISGHYHRSQDIKCGPPRKGGLGLFSYIGNPYTLSFAEASDGPKGFKILMDNGMLEHVPTNMREHVVVEYAVKDLQDILGKAEDPIFYVKKGDLLWVKVSGTKSELAEVDKAYVAQLCGISGEFKLDKIFTDSDRLDTKVKSMTDKETFSRLIDNMNELEEHKQYLKNLWEEICDEIEES